MKKCLLILVLFALSNSAVHAQTQVPVYAFYNAAAHVHFYTVTPSEVTSAQGWAPDYPPTLGKLYVTPSGGNPGSTTVHRYYNPSTRAHYYTLNNSAPSGFVFESIIGYEPGTPHVGMIPIYEYSHPWGDYYYTQSSLTPAGYHYDGIAFYVYN